MSLLRPFWMQPLAQMWRYTAFNASQVAKLLANSESSLLFADARHVETAAAAIGDRQIQLVLMDDSPDATVNRQSASGNSVVLDQVLAAGPGDFRPADAAP